VTRIGIGLAAVLLALGLARAAPADLVPSPPAPAAAPAAAETPAPPETISAPEIVTRAEVAKALARRILAQTADDAVRAEIETSLPETSAKLRDRKARADTLLEGTPTLDAINDLLVEWRARATRLLAWRNALTKSAQQIESERAELQHEREIWERTRDAPDAAALPPATLARVNETVAVLQNADKEVSRQRAATLSLQSEVAEEEVVVNGMVERVAKLRDDVGQRLFQRDAPPLWSAAAYAPSGDPHFVPQKLRAAFARRVDLLLEFSDLSIARLEIEAVVFLFVLGALVAARRRVQRRPQPEGESDAALAASRRIFLRPISAAFVVAYAVATWVLPRAPGLASELETLVVMVPVLRLLPFELGRDLRAGIWSLAALFFVGAVRQALSALPIVERFLILPELFGLLALFFWVLRPERAARLRALGRVGGAVVPFVRTASVLCLSALVANALGMALLARVILRGVLTGLYGAIAIYALVRFGSGVVTALLRSSVAQRLRLVREHGEIVRHRIINLMVWTGVGVWVYGGLQALGMSDQIGSSFATVLGAKLEVGTVSISLGNLVAFGVTLWVSFLLSRFVRFVLDEDVLPRLTLPRGVPAAISTGTHYLILVAGFLLAIGAAGIDLGKFSLLAGALGVGIGFGLQNVVNNFVSGLILLFERPVQTGDIIEVGPISGEVKRIGIRSSTVRTFDGADVILPNASLISERLVNWTFSDRLRRVDLDVGVSYDADANKVLALLLETAKAHPEVLSLPEPQAFFTKFQDSSLGFSLRVWCRFELAPRIKSELGIAVHQALCSAGIEIPFPQTHVQLKMSSDAKQ